MFPPMSTAFMPGFKTSVKSLVASGSCTLYSASSREIPGSRGKTAISWPITVKDLCPRARNHIHRQESYNHTTGLLTWQRISTSKGKAPSSRYSRRPIRHLRAACSIIEKVGIGRQIVEVFKVVLADMGLKPDHQIRPLLPVTV
jgi:hypothetical protein